MLGVLALIGYSKVCPGFLLALPCCTVLSATKPGWATFPQTLVENSVIFEYKLQNHYTSCNQAIESQSSKKETIYHLLLSQGHFLRDLVLRQHVLFFE